MTDVTEDRERLNLYYIFEKDKQAHPMPPAQVEALRSHLKKILSQT